MFEQKNADRVRTAILQEYGLPKKEVVKHLEKLLHKYGRVAIEPAETLAWEQIFDGEWNRYELYKTDLAKMRKWLNSGEVELQAHTLSTNNETWYWLACLSYLYAKPKESPNHIFLKELLRLYFQRHLQTSTQKEQKSTVFEESIRYDLYSEKEKIVGEVGGVQLWKVMISLEKEFTVYVMPHWTDDKTRPFMKRVTRYKLYRMERRTNCEGTK